MDGLVGVDLRQEPSPVIPIYTGGTFPCVHVLPGVQQEVDYLDGEEGLPGPGSAAEERSAPRTGAQRVQEILQGVPDHLALFGGEGR